MKKGKEVCGHLPTLQDDEIKQLYHWSKQYVVVVDISILLAYRQISFIFLFVGCLM